MRAVLFCIVILTAACPCVAAPGVGGCAIIGDSRAVMGTRVGALDSLDNDDSPVLAQYWIAGSYHSADEWASSAGFYAYDLRFPLQPGETKTWTLYIWGVPGEATHGFTVQGGGISTEDPLVNATLELGTETGRYHRKTSFGNRVDPAAIALWAYTSALHHIRRPDRLRVQVHADNGPRTLLPRRRPRWPGRVRDGDAAAEEDAIGPLTIGPAPAIRRGRHSPCTRRFRDFHSASSIQIPNYHEEVACLSCVR